LNPQAKRQIMEYIDRHLREQADPDNRPAGSS
jgi:hypothetical protein